VEHRKEGMDVNLSLRETQARMTKEDTENCPMGHNGNMENIIKELIRLFKIL